jgi:hypothetical protein
VSDSDNMRRHALECMRLAADCKQLAGDVRNPAWQSHLLRMAKIWTTQAVRGYPDQEVNGFTEPARGLRDGRSPALR